MSTNGKFLVGSVLERKPSKPAVPPRPINSTSLGFPSVQHRSKSAFARSIEEARKSVYAGKDTRPQAPPIVVSSSSTSTTSDVQPKQMDVDDWREKMSTENEIRVANMTDEEREVEKREIIERFGVGIGDVLKRARLAREKNAAKDSWPNHKPRPPPPPLEADAEAFKSLSEVPISEEEPAPSRPNGRGFSPPPALSRPHSRPSSRMDRKLRFAELGPNDVFVYESAPPSPKRKPLALPPAVDDGTAISLGQWHDAPEIAGKDQGAPKAKVEEPEEGTSEYIRRRYFPAAPPNDPNLAWMRGNPLPEPADQSSTSLRFDLHGNVIPLSIATKLPTHLGLHHHAEGSTAGYTLDDIFLLSRSTVSAQRATMLGVLAQIVLNLGETVKGESLGLKELIPKAEEIRKRVMAAGVEAMNERGSVGVRAIEAVWASIVGWNEVTMYVEGVELQQDSDAAISSLQLDFFLPQIATALSQGDVLPESLTQLLAILHRLAQQSNTIAETIVQMPKLLTSVFQALLLTPIPPREQGPLPEPAALQFLITLAMATRSNAETLKEPADALLRFISLLPPSSPFPFALATSLLTLTLRFYRVLASYGLYSNIATVAMEPFSRLSQYVFSPSCESQALRIAWLELLSAWTVCAIDPHKTTPDHDILWSQVTSWSWKDEIAQFAEKLGDQESDWKAWGAVWRAEAQWLEGCKINGVKGGESERTEFLQSIEPTFHDGSRGRVVLAVVSALQEDLEAEDLTNDLERAAFHASLLGIAVQLWLACLPPHIEGPLESPPFELPLPAISAIGAKLVAHPLWDNFGSNEVTPQNYVHARQLSGFLATYLTLSRRLPGISEELWVAQALSILLRLIPSDEDFARGIVDQLLDLVTPEWVNQRNIAFPTIIWERGGFGILRPFLSHTIWRNKACRVAPLQITPRSIATSSTLRLPMVSRCKEFGLPLDQDWMLTSLDHLLRSADSEVFKSLPDGWDSSETEITRATIFFANLSRNALARFSLNQFSLSREEVVFGCMRVFMLEHGQSDSESSGEVFRDSIVERLMAQMLEPYTYERALVSSSRPVRDLEQVAARFLGSTPLFQFYTDFVGLYDAISFSESTFAKLLLPPTSTYYAFDYRKHLWVDFNHILKTIRTPCEQVLSDDLKEYMYPIENDSQLIGAYLRALLKEPLQGFLRLVAVHHIASSIWPDLRDEELTNEARAEKLIKAVAAQGSIEVVREVISYRQNKSGPTWLPPVCFELAGDVASTRLAWIKALGDAMVISRLEGLMLQL
ncbi:RNA polymerase II-associated protein 1 [Leucoagaricus sp. SymC.cos]|nr:RNA polymerase II-associated protein 1 [Leucoagaricus sp. SymC.cos]